MQYNKGEWSELYVLFKVFYDREIAAADENLMPTTERYKFLEVIRDEGEGEKFYNLETDDVVKILAQDGALLSTIDIQDLPEKTKKIFDEIRANGGERAFCIPDAVLLMSKYGLKKVKASSKKKSDIEAMILDKLSSRRRLGFSIKSQAGGASTLLNTSAQTKFRYRVLGLGNNEIAEVNSSKRGKGLIKSIYEKGGYLEFDSMMGSAFEGNLRMIDTVLPNIMASMLLAYFKDEGNKVADLCKIVAANNPYRLTEKDIDFKIKIFLRAIALGMVPGEPWSAYLSSYGGYIIVKDNGELVCYHLYNDDEFKDYLFNSTKFDTPSTSRHDYCYVYNDGNEPYLDLNYQIRFIK